MRVILGKSVQDREVRAYANFFASGPSQSRRSALFIGGTHGDERATVPILENFISGYLESGKVATATSVISLLNPDGWAGNTRYNGRGIDLNRNFPHQWSPQSDEPPGEHPLSEPEARLLHDFILAHRPAKIVSLHWALAEIDADGAQSAPLARRMWDALEEEERKPYRLRLPEPGLLPVCPGSLGQWCGHGLVYPEGYRPAMVTLELPYHPHAQARPEELPDDHLATVGELWRSAPDAYLAGVEAAVHRLLAVACEAEHTADGAS